MRSVDNIWPNTCHPWYIHFGYTIILMAMGSWILYDYINMISIWGLQLIPLTIDP